MARLLPIDRGSVSTRFFFERAEPRVPRRIYLTARFLRLLAARAASSILRARARGINYISPLTADGRKADAVAGRPSARVTQWKRWFSSGHRTDRGLGLREVHPGAGKRTRNRRCASRVDKQSTRVSTIRSINISLDTISRGPLFHLRSDHRHFFHQLYTGPASPAILPRSARESSLRSGDRLGNSREPGVQSQTRNGERSSIWKNHRTIFRVLAGDRQRHINGNLVRTEA